MATVTLSVLNGDIPLSLIEDSVCKAKFKYNILSSTSIIVHTSNIDSLKAWTAQYENNEGITMVFNTIVPTTRLRRTAKPDRSIRSSNVRYFNMTQIRAIYGIPNPSVPVVVGVISFGGGLYGTVDQDGVLTNGDVQAYWTSIGIAPQNHPKVIIKTVNGATNTPDIDDMGSTLENTLDVETVGGACPSSNLTIILYIAPNSIDSFYPVFNYALNTPIVVNSITYKPTILSVSWGIPEIYLETPDINSINGLLQTASVNGVNICTATGDFGSNNGVGGSGAYCDFPSSCPYVTAVGGTSLTCPNNVYDSSTTEVAWSSGGGGISTVFPKPTYQSAIVATGRSIPDVAAVADPNTGVVYIVNGETLLIGGTSVAAPIVAGFLATVNTLRFINPLIYSAPAISFHDILTGSNGAYSARAGYDNCTGFGTPNATDFKNAIIFTLATSISLSSSSLTLQVNQTRQLVATISPNTASSQSISWSTSNSQIATVSSNGLVTALGPGSAIITATTTDGTALSANCALTVSGASVTVTGVQLNTAGFALYPTQTYQLVATVSPANATDKTVAWTSNSSNGSVSDTGLVTAISAGAFRITATTQNGGFTAVANFTVTVPVTGVSLNTTSYNLRVGQSARMDPIIIPSDATNKSVTYISTNSSVATVNSLGVIAAIGNGTCTITVRTVNGNFTASATVNVTTLVSKITLNASRITKLTTGQTYRTVARVTPENANNKTLAWSSSDINVATVSAVGLVTAIGNGVSVIAATSTDGSNISANFTVTVTTNVTGIALNASTLSLARNATSQLIATVSPVSASNKAITWSSTNSTNVSVSNTGLVTAKRIGTATIRATTVQGRFIASCIVTVI